MRRTKMAGKGRTYPCRGEGGKVWNRRVSPLPRVPAKSPDWSDSGRSAVSAGTSLHVKGFRTPALH